MNRISGLLTGAMLAALLLGSTALAVASQDDKVKKPVAHTNPATSVGARSATLAGELKHEGSSTTFRFEYGPTTSYGQSTAVGTLAVDDTNQFRPLSAVVSGLTPETVYHFRVRADNAKGTSTGADRSFTTTAAGTTPEGTSGEQAAPPRLGSSLLIAPVEGTIKVKRRGAADYSTLAAGESIPVGSLVDTRQGTVELTSSLGHGKTQSGEFGGALFKLGQSRKSHGMTDLVLRGSYIASCGRSAAYHKRKPPKRRLFGRDKGGRFRTYGLDSIATVRGTSWVTTDTCAGTRTTVHKGAVSVRKRGGTKTVLVRAGQSYLAVRHRR